MNLQQPLIAMNWTATSIRFTRASHKWWCDKTWRTRSINYRQLCHQKLESLLKAKKQLCLRSSSLKTWLPQENHQLKIVSKRVRSRPCSRIPATKSNQSKQWDPKRWLGMVATSTQTASCLHSSRLTASTKYSAKTAPTETKPEFKSIEPTNMKSCLNVSKRTNGDRVEREITCRSVALEVWTLSIEKHLLLATKVHTGSWATTWLDWRAKQTYIAPTLNSAPLQMRTKFMQLWSNSQIQSTSWLTFRNRTVCPSRLKVKEMV